MVGIKLVIVATDRKVAEKYLSHIFFKPLHEKVVSLRRGGCEDKLIARFVSVPKGMKIPQSLKLSFFGHSYPTRFIHHGYSIIYACHPGELILEHRQLVGFEEITAFLPQCAQHNGYSSIH